MRDHHVIVHFGPAIPAAAQGEALLALERLLRALAPGVRAEVFKQSQGDDSKLRAAMTPEQRAKL